MLLKTNSEKQVAPTGVINAAKRTSSGRTKPRSIVELGSKIAELYHRDGVRHFELAGPNPIPSDERAAVRWIGGLKRILKSREVGRISFGMTTPTFEFRPRVREALVDIGFARPSQQAPALASFSETPAIKLTLAAS
jgi:hypothetical protein